MTSDVNGNGTWQTIAGGGGVASDVSCPAGCVDTLDIADGAITNADINPAAAIAPSKIAGTAATLGANNFSGDQTITGNVSVSSNLAVDATTLVVDAANNRVGMGMASPTEALHVIGNVLASGSITQNSSRRFKGNIQTLTGAVERVERMRGVSFDWIDGGKHDVGVIAEEMREVLPEVVLMEANGVDAKGVDYARLTAVLIEAVKEQQGQIQQLKSEVEGLKQRMGTQVSRAVPGQQKTGGGQ